MTSDDPDGTGRTARLPLLDAAALRAAGRTPPAPFRIRLASGSELRVVRLLRVLPARRIVGEADLDGERVLAKIFIDQASERHWRSEHDGIAALTRAGIPTPEIVLVQSLACGGHVLLTRFLDRADTVLEAWRPLATRPPGDAAALQLLGPVFALLGRSHAAGIAHEDLHFGNFLRHAGRLLLIDGDAVRTGSGAPLPEPVAARDLAQLIAQLPYAWDERLAPLLAAYGEGNPRTPSQAVLEKALREQRAWRLRDYLGKTIRDCTLFSVSKRFDRFVSVLRSEAAALAPLIDDPDAWMARGVALKRGNTSTVARVGIDGRLLVVKRYNIKDRLHALSRCWRPSRAWHAWREGHRLRLMGVPTPAPLALIEERFGPLRRRAWLVTEHCPGPDLLTHLGPHVSGQPPAAEAAALPRLFRTLHRERISHGDMKATNLLWHDEDVALIDLDAMVRHRSEAAHARAWQRDRARLLRNWPAGSGLHRWLDENLPK